MRRRRGALPVGTRSREHDRHGRGAPCRAGMRIRTGSLRCPRGLQPARGQTDRRHGRHRVRPLERRAQGLPQGRARRHAPSKPDVRKTAAGGLGSPSWDHSRIPRSPHRFSCCPGCGSRPSRGPSRCSSDDGLDEPLLWRLHPLPTRAPDGRWSHPLRACSTQGRPRARRPRSAAHPHSASASSEPSRGNLLLVLIAVFVFFGANPEERATVRPDALST